MTTSRLASDIAYKKLTGTRDAAYKKLTGTRDAAYEKYTDRGSSGKSQYSKEYTAAGSKYNKDYTAAGSKYSEDYTNVERYGKDAMKGKGFATTGRPKSINAGASRPATQSGTPKSGKK